MCYFKEAPTIPSSGSRLNYDKIYFVFAADVAMTAFKFFDCAKDGQVPLLSASCRGHVAVVELLLHHGAKHSLPNKVKYTAP